MQDSHWLFFCLILSFFCILPVTAYPDDPFIAIDTIGNHYIGDVFFINGTTNLPVGDRDMKLDVRGLWSTPGGCRGCFEYSTNLTIIPGSDNINHWATNVTDIGISETGFYGATVSNQFPDASATSTFRILPPRNATAAPVSWFFLGSSGNRTYFAANFLDHSSNYPDSWNWSFGDGTFSTEISPEHVFPHEGVYHVSLTVSNSMGSNTSVMEICWPMSHYDYQAGRDVQGLTCTIKYAMESPRVQQWISMLILPPTFILIAWLIWRSRQKKKME